MVSARIHLKQMQMKLLTNESQLKISHRVETQLKYEIKNLQNKIRLTFEDSVTNLLGRKVFEDRLSQSIKESDRHQLILAVLFVDIVNFKMINDALSYEIGDLLLQEVAKRLQASVRSVDSLTRFGKDTFVILLTRLMKPETAALVAQRLLQILKNPFKIKEHELFIHVCMGIAIYPSDGKSMAELLRNADYALQEAKKKGKDTYQFYQAEMYQKSQRELALHTSLNRETLFQELKLLYQPIMNVTNETIFGMDILINWVHPQLGLVAPKELFRYADIQHKLDLITEWILKKACQQFLHWRSLGFFVNFIGVPISIHQIKSTQFVYRMFQILQEMAFNPEWILFEIKDMAAFPFSMIEKGLNMLKYKGIKIAIDHFGLESFPLLLLKEMKVHYLKLDQALIMDINENPQSKPFIESLIVLANSLSLQLIIQGIESQEQMELLKSLGCSLMQGKLFSAPLSEHEVASKMVAQV